MICFILGFFGENHVVGTENSSAIPLFNVFEIRQSNLARTKTVFFPVKKPHSEEISSGAILGTNLSFTKGGGGSVSFVQDQVTS